MEEPTKEPAQKTRIVFKRNQAPNDTNNKPDNNNPLDRNKKPTGPKFSFYWIYGILAVLFLFFSYFSNNTAKTITTKELKQMLYKGDVSRVVVVNRSKAEIFLTDSAKNKTEYKKDLGEGNVFADTKAPN
jgi:cell division protease FtsH